MANNKFQTHLASYVALRNEKGEYLLQRRKNTGYLDGYYDFAASGHVETGETAPEAAVREALEEAGVQVKAEDLHLIRIQQHNVNLAYLNFIFVCESWQGTPKIMEPEKCDDLAWFPPGAFPQKCTPAVRVCEKANFAESLVFSHLGPENFKAIIGFDLAE